MGWSVPYPRGAAGLVLGSLLLGSATVSAQIPAAAIEGSVTDATSAVIARASVEVREIGTGARRRAETGANGRFMIGSLEPGEYEVLAAAPGFAIRRQRVALRVGAQLTLDFELSLGNLGAQVDVSSSAP